MNGMATIHSFATAIVSFELTSSTAAAMKLWARCGVIWTCPRAGARRSGKTRRRATRRPVLTNGGTGTTVMCRVPRLIRNGWRYLMPVRPRSARRTSRHEFVGACTDAHVCTPGRAFSRPGESDLLDVPLLAVDRNGIHV